MSNDVVRHEGTPKNKRSEKKTTDENNEKTQTLKRKNSNTQKNCLALVHRLSDGSGEARVESWTLQRVESIGN